MGKDESLTLEQMCVDSELEKAVLKELSLHGTSSKLQKFEIPGALKLCSEVWTPDMGLVTAAFKLKRKNIQEHYQADINKMYS
jgi:long-chain acyl-CoA synthetase